MMIKKSTTDRFSRADGLSMLGEALKVLHEADLFKPRGSSLRHQKTDLQKKPSAHALPGVSALQVIPFGLFFPPTKQER